MSYEKQNFTPGQVLKAEHLNYMEEGIANASASEPIIFTTMDFATVTCNKSFAECMQAFNDNNFQAYLFTDIPNNRQAIRFAVIGEGNRIDDHGEYIVLTYSLTFSGIEINVNYGDYGLEIVVVE